MITSKQRSYLRGLANTLIPIFQIGKGGVEENFIKQIDSALEKRELIKIKILNNSDYDAREVQDDICKILRCEGVQSIGKTFVIYRESINNKRIELPK